MSLAQKLTRPTIADRIAALEEKGKVHDKMAEQFAEIYEAWSRLKTINWFFVKLIGYGGGALGAVAVVLTIWEKAGLILGHH